MGENEEMNVNVKQEWVKPEPTILTKEQLSEMMVANARTDGCGLCGCSCGMYCYFIY